MPGIAGCITRRAPQDARADVRQMVEAMCHEDFYTAGTWSADPLGIHVGWAARRDSYSDANPLRNEHGDVALIFSGEEYSAPDAKRQLKCRGHVFDSCGPSWLVHLYEESPSFPDALNGRFNGLLIDETRSTAMLFNDRYGMGRVYFADTEDGFYFAAEAKAILAVRPELRHISVQGVAEFLSCGAVLENRTLFEGIHQLPGGSAWTFRNGRLERKASYFQPNEWEEQEPLDPEAYFRELRDVFMRNLPRYFDGPQRVAMSLTGGLDTRMIMAGWNPEPHSLPCYTFGSMFRTNQDVRVARHIAEVCGQTHQVLTSGPEFLSRFGHYAERAVYLTDGCVDVGRAPDLYLNEQARQIAPVRMTGLYGGEILRGIGAIKPSPTARQVFQPELLREMERASGTCAQVQECHPISFAAFRQGPWALWGSLMLEETQLTMRTPFLDNDFVRTVFRMPVGTLGSSESSLRLIGEGNPGLLVIPTDRNAPLKGNTAIAAASHFWMEFLFKAEYAFDVGMPQWLARTNHALARLRLERLFLGRHKPFHFRVWYRNELAQYIQDILLSECSLSRPYIQRKGLESIVDGHIRGNRNSTADLHKLLTLELVQRQLLGAHPPVRRKAFEDRDIAPLVC
jgi:asparagine synthase (glutamine-hydrolysing)